MAEDREVTIYDIAKYLNISAATVSRGLKNNPTISKKTCKKIIDTANMLGYQSNAFASNLRSRQTHTLGVLIPRLNSHFMSSVLAGMENAANAHGYNLIIAQSLEDVEKEKRNVLTMFNKRVDGLLISLSADATGIEHLEPFFKRKIPVVFFDRVYAHTDSLSVGIDNQAAAYDITTHLIRQGCKRIMHLGGNLLRNVYHDRFKGYRKALREYHLPFKESYHLVSNGSEQAGTAAAQYILDLPPAERPDAVFSANDTAAVFCMLALKAAGLNIPGDIAFAGFNNDPISKVIEPNLTTMNYSGDQIGHTAASRLIDHLKSENNRFTTSAITLRADMVIRASSLKKG
ncbi:LacI family DNA-binding transcriptional regulator [Chitinophaga sp. Cy-1792]|uniref:LacI family DNA-binding transcriptional regulator n=1 Tax=Chitinophaga sp. Cy-1792 TaxID=2608339 RepID=UPI0014211657|nr:LacI family DNA-binding transcriptional regulator [Chitinophaga sp. Cy-1792]NIG54472.1 LacI family transcriptional regulator [Chitinophaga sp. Cy-1792]